MAPEKSLEQVMLDLQNSSLERIAKACENFRESDETQNNPIEWTKGYEAACLDVARLCRSLQH